nr:hypothetical protein [Cohnella faecalis]
MAGDYRVRNFEVGNRILARSGQLIVLAGGADPASVAVRMRPDRFILSASDARRLSMLAARDARALRQKAVPENYGLSDAVAYTVQLFCPSSRDRLTDHNRNISVFCVAYVSLCF